ncbi:FAD-binding domain-containing protein [Roseibium sp.]|uniref:FAD-binding domain-containing protein n=1 Tax=Roseibium sp. TaxID=1936156 RepID=UPI003A9825CC
MFGNGSKLQVVWFKRDLRSYDHEALFRAAEHGPVLPLFIVEPELWQQPDMSARQYAFVLESIEELRHALARRGQPLVIRTGGVTEILATLHNSYGIAALWAHEETGNAWTFERDIAVAAWCKQNGVPFHEFRQTGVIRRLRDRNGWARRWDEQMAGSLFPEPVLAPVGDIDPGCIPSERDIGLKPDPCPGRQPGGRRAGLACLESFLTKRGLTYRRAMSSPLEGFDACSRISPHLAWGTLSMKEVAQRTWNAQRDLKSGLGPAGGRGWSGALSSFSGRLHWHCHFMQKLEDQPDLEFKALHQETEDLRPREIDPARFAAWANGETGLPFVDACMRALHATGWMNFRMRAMLMAVSSYQLWLDWRRPGQHLARLFTDYEPGIHWPQVQMQSGTTGINTIRIYNPVKQGKDQDPEGKFIRRWLPELRDLPDYALHEPWTSEQAAGVLGKSYPFPIVDHLSAAREARAKVWALRKGDGFHQTAREIQDRHGSRKSGIPMRGRKTEKKKSAGQLDLFAAAENMKS